MMKRLLAGGWMATAVLGLALQAQEPAPPRSGPPRGGDVADPFSTRRPGPPQDEYAADAPPRGNRDGQQSPRRPDRELQPERRREGAGAEDMLGGPGLPGGNPPGRDQRRPDPVQQQLAEAVRKLQSPDASEADRQEARKLVSDELRRQFDADLELRRQQLDDLERQIARLREQLQKRTEAKEKLVELRLQLLENESLGLGFPEQWRRLPGTGEPAGFGGSMPGGDQVGIPMGIPGAMSDWNSGGMPGGPGGFGMPGSGGPGGFFPPQGADFGRQGPHWDGPDVLGRGGRPQPESYRGGPGPIEGRQSPESRDRGPRPPESPQPPRQPPVRAVDPNDAIPEGLSPDVPAERGGASRSAEPTPVEPSVKDDDQESAEPTAGEESAQ